MASVNALARELVFKIVYYGPGLSGKTSTLQYIHAATRPEHRGKMVSLATPVDRTLYFDFLPIRLPMVRGMGVRIQLFTVPGQVYYNATRKLVLTGADGLVFVADSQAGRVDANLETLENLRANLAEHGRSLASVPHVLQHNKRDLNDVLRVEDLDHMLNEHRAPSFGTTATKGDGVFEALEAISKGVVASFEASMPAGTHSLSASLEAIEGGLSEALRNANPGDAEIFAGPPPVIATLTGPPEPDGDRDGATSHLGASDRGAEAPGELAARAVTKSDAHLGFSLAELWPESERSSVREAETAIASRRYARAIELCDVLVMRVLASAAGVLGGGDAPRDPAAIPMLLGLDGRQYLAFRALVREARSGVPIEARRALEAMTFAAHARVLRATL
jgi:signal recognition particle receptor subunit beta